MKMPRRSLYKTLRLNPVQKTPCAAISWVSFSIALAASLIIPVLQAQPTFVPVGPEGGIAMDISDDGQIVVGNYTPSPGEPSKAYRWENGSFIELPPIPGRETQQYRAESISGDGEVIVGVTYGASGPEAFIWDIVNGTRLLPGMPANADGMTAYNVNYDGTVVAGEVLIDGVYQAMRWTAPDTVELLGFLDDNPPAPESPESYADGISADGQVVIGASRSSTGYEAFRWTSALGMENIGDLPGGNVQAYGNDMSADGDFIVGESENAVGYEAFIWSEANGMVALGDLPGGVHNSYAMGVSNEGLRVVGVGRDSEPVGGEAILWTPDKGMRSLRDVMIDEYGLRDFLQGWELQVARAISPTGKWLAGYGTNPNGKRQGWRAKLSGAPPFLFTTIFDYEYDTGTNSRTNIVQDSAGTIYGTTSSGGGPLGRNVLFRIDSDGSNYQVLKQFQQEDFYGSRFLDGDLLLVNDSTIVGATNSSLGDVEIYSIGVDGSNYQSIYRYYADTFAEKIRLSIGSDGRIYGTNRFGPQIYDEYGTLFAVGLNGQNFELLYQFSSSENVRPETPLLEVDDGRFFFGNQRSIYAFDPVTSTVSTIYTLNSGSFPGPQSLIQGSDGRIYGTVYSYDLNNGGAVFTLNPSDDSLVFLHDFSRATDGSHTNVGVVEGLDGRLYGTTNLGGTKDKGTIYRMQKSGTGFEVIHNFDPDFGDPNNVTASLAVSVDGGLLGVSRSGGAYNFGSIFKIRSSTTTSAGSNVVVAPVLTDASGEPVEDAPEVTLEFPEITETGSTTITYYDSPPSDLPEGVDLGEPAFYIDIESDATFSGDVEVTFDYSGISFTGDPQNLKLAHNANGEWVDITVRVDEVNMIIYGSTSSFSPFAIVETEDPIELLAELVEAVSLLNAKHGIINSLDSKLSNAEAALLDAKAQNDISALNKVMSSFSNAVEAQRDKEISVSEADDLLQQANKIVGILKFLVGN